VGVGLAAGAGAAFATAQAVTTLQANSAFNGMRSDAFSRVRNHFFESDCLNYSCCIFEQIKKKKKMDLLKLD
jgi:hypothetical protein